MIDWNKNPLDNRRKRWWAAFGATIVFALVGLALAPSLVRREPSSLPQPDPLEARLESRTQADEPKGSRDRIESVSEVTSPDLTNSLEAHSFDCMVMPNEVIEIGSAITGLIEEILVERGDYVEAGQTVARLESTVEQAAVRVAEARAHRRGELESSRVSLELGQKRRQRAVDLYRRDSLSLDAQEEVETGASLAALELEQARENLRIASLQLDQAIAFLERHTIRSPISGFVTERLMAPGEIVDEETMLRIAQIDPLRVEVILPSQLFGRIRPGDRAEIVPEPPLDQARDAEVAIVDPLIDGPSGTFGARLLLPNPDHGLPAGLRCQVRFLDDG
jgi:RND family efflux transporter MFP subunit